nr:aspartate kinase [bacterium]
MGTIVCKFGGASVADEKQIHKVEAIIRSNFRRRFIIPSAPGKRFKNDTKITDLLYSCHDKANNDVDISETFKIIRQRYTDIATSLCSELDIAQLLDDLEDKIENGASKDYVASRGEYLCGKIIAALLGANFIDPVDGILFSDNGRLDEQSYERLSELLKGDGLFVIPGFY